MSFLGPAFGINLTRLAPDSGSDSCLRPRNMVAHPGELRQDCEIELID